MRLDTQLFSLREERIAVALLKDEPKWAKAVDTDGEFQTVLWYMTRTVITMLDGAAAKWAWRIEDLDLTVRAYNVLKREGVHTVAQLLEYSSSDLLDFRNMGEGGIRSIVDELAKYDLKLKGAA